MDTPKQSLVMNTRLEIESFFAQARDYQIVNSLLDTDFYKFPMNQLQKSWLSLEEQKVYGTKKTWGETEVTFSWINRSQETIKPHEVINIDALREQLEAVRKLKMTPAELSYLAGTPINPERTKRMFSSWYIKSLDNFQLPEFCLEKNKDGSFRLNFQGKWETVTFWEIIAMSIISEMYYYGLLKQSGISPQKFAAIYGKMMGRLEDMVKMFKKNERIRIAEFGGRRRHSRQWHYIAYHYLLSEIPNQILGTSNVELSMKTGSANAIGTNAHELSMVIANLGDDSDGYIRQSQYSVIERWQKMYPELSILLPDTFGTKQFLDHAPAWVARSVGARIDSMEEKKAIDMYTEWWKQHGENPQEKLLIASDGLTPEKAVNVFRENSRKIGRLSFGIGTNITNNCKNVCEISGFQPFSQVAKITQANGKPAVKLSDNPRKATGATKRVEKFKNIFGIEGSEKIEVEV